MTKCSFTFLGCEVVTHTTAEGVGAMMRAQTINLVLSTLRAVFTYIAFLSLVLTHQGEYWSEVVKQVDILRMTNLISRCVVSKTLHTSISRRQ